MADLHHVRLSRQAQFEDRPELPIKAERSRFLELWAAREADVTLTHSIAEAGMLRDDITPSLQRRDPSITCKLVGVNLRSSLRQAGPGLNGAGHVADLATVFDSVRLTVAPPQFGAGLKGKVIASLAVGVPCVCSPVAG